MIAIHPVSESTLYASIEYQHQLIKNVNHLYEVSYQPIYTSSIRPFLYQLPIVLRAQLSTDQLSSYHYSKWIQHGNIVFFRTMYAINSFSDKEALLFAYLDVSDDDQTVLYMNCVATTMNMIQYMVCEWFNPFQRGIKHLVIIALETLLDMNNPYVSIRHGTASFLSEVEEKNIELFTITTYDTMFARKAVQFAIENKWRNHGETVVRVDKPLEVSHVFSCYGLSKKSIEQCIPYFLLDSTSYRVPVMCIDTERSFSRWSVHSKLYVRTYHANVLKSIPYPETYFDPVQLIDSVLLYMKYDMEQYDKNEKHNTLTTSVSVSHGQA
jgi:hypothetical protein